MFDSQFEEGFYKKLVEAGYPEDRILTQYSLSDRWRADIAIMAPGLSQVPMCIIEVKGHLQSDRMNILRTKFERNSSNFHFQMYVYSGIDDTLFEFDSNLKLKKIESFPSYEQLKNKWLENRTYLSKLNLKNFMVFKSEEFQFGSRLNIIIGENGSGKTQLMKLIYSIMRSLTYRHFTSNEMISSLLTCIANVFKVNNLAELLSDSAISRGKKINIQYELSEAGVEKTANFLITTSEKNTPVEDKISNNLFQHVANKVIFIPINELLSIFPGFAYMRQIYLENWPYDKTVSDCINYLGLPTIQSQGNFYNEIVQEIEKAIHGHIYLNEQTTKFLMQMENSKAIHEIPLVATGWCKLGQLLQLINTGAIYPGSILLWDEPDANLNPKLICIVAKILLKLANAGVQVFIATHSLFLLRELEYLSHEQNLTDSIRYISLGKDRVEQADNTYELQTILSFEEEIKQEERIIALGGRK